MLHLSSLKIEGYPDSTIIDDTFMLYMMKKFSNLKALLLRIDNIDITGTDNPNRVTLSTDITVQFLKYLFKLPHCMVDTIVTAKNTAMVIKEFCSTAKIDQTTFPVLQIKYDYYYERKQYPILDVDTYCEERYTTPRVIGVTCDGGGRGQQPEHRVIKEAGHFFSHIAVNRVFDGTYRFTSLLKYIAKYCVRLEKLTLEECCTLENSKIEEWSVNNNSFLTKLEIRRTPLLTQYFCLLFSSLFPNLNTLIWDRHRYLNFEDENGFTLNLSNLSYKYLQMDLCSTNRLLKDNVRRFNGVCVNVLLAKGNCVASFLFSFLPSSYYLLKFVKPLNNSEKQTIENDKIYFMFNLQCSNNIEKLTVKYRHVEEYKYIYKTFDICSSLLLN